MFPPFSLISLSPLASWASTTFLTFPYLTFQASSFSTISHLPLTSHLIESASPSAVPLKLLPKSRQLPSPGSFSQALSCLQCWVLLTASSSPLPGLCDSALTQVSCHFLAFHQFFCGLPLKYQWFLAFCSLLLFFFFLLWLYSWVISFIPLVSAVSSNLLCIRAGVDKFCGTQPCPLVCMLSVVNFMLQ